MHASASVRWITKISMFLVLLVLSISYFWQRFFTLYFDIILEQLFILIRDNHFTVQPNRHIVHEHVYFISRKNWFSDRTRKLHILNQTRTFSKNKWCEDVSEEVVIFNGQHGSTHGIYTITQQYGHIIQLKCLTMYVSVSYEESWSGERKICNRVTEWFKCVKC